LKALGVDIAVAPEVMTQCLDDIGIAFLFAPSLHPAMKHAIGPRRELGIRTIFNILGPLSNPASSKRGVLGVYSPDLVRLVAQAAAATGSEHLFVVHGRDGLDEITNTAETIVGEVHKDGIKYFDLKPEDLGMKRAQAEDLLGGEPDDNAAITRAILEGESGPRRDIVVLNAGAAIAAGEDALSIAEGVERAQAAIDSGAAREKLEQLILRTNR
ncbi:MAG: anthranilate phosphoribosyltransferase, partial [Verrucomicrobiales bacterium]